ncbi:MAG: mechanosensitive ion channel family protein [Planctomycetota bacterium]|jgi:miniconductance mechanosensitive channel|nr:mechanosensitive ion channel family protein [Planctomycetota bacterium]
MSEMPPDPELSETPVALTETFASRFETLGEWSHAWLGRHLPEWMNHEAIILTIHLVAIAVTCLVVFAIARKVFLPLIGKVVDRSKAQWDDVLEGSLLFKRLSGVAPAAVVYLGAVGLLQPWPVLRVVGERVSLVTMVVYGLLAFFSVLTAGNALYEKRDGAANRPIKGYLSLIKIITVVITAIVAIGILIDKSPALLLTGLGAMTAVLLLIFKDTILSVVASITLGLSDMVRKGDWIVVPSAGADGDVIDIALHHVTVQNWDKTLVTIPTYKLMADSFTNWRGMTNAGGRRIKRSLAVDMNTIRFLNTEEIDRFADFKLLGSYITDKRAALEQANKDLPEGMVANARRLTNVGTFRAYVANYLRGLDSIHQQGLTFLVRQLQPTAHGLPIEIYVFTKTTVWSEFEGIQSDIFDHLLAIAPEFGLRVFQAPSGSDFASLIASNN